MCKLFLFPEAPDYKRGGYSMAVASDIKSLQINSDDLVVFWTVDDSDENKIKISQFTNNRNIYFLRRKTSLEEKVFMLLRGKLHSIFWDLNFLNSLKNKYEISSIFCGDTVFYPSVKKIFPDHEIHLRFHNLWLKIRARFLVSGKKFYSIKFVFIVWFLSRIELKTFSDSKVFQKIFINESDANMYHVLTCRSDFSVMNVVSDIRIWNAGIDLTLDDSKVLNLIWFGSVASHTADGLKWFIRHVYKKLQKTNRIRVRLFLFGEGTKKFHQPSSNIFSFGRFDGDQIPMCGNGLFIVPDLSGGGTKLKVRYFIENNLHFITTPEGFEGYEEYNRKAEIYIINAENWLSFLDNMYTELHFQM